MGKLEDPFLSPDRLDSSFRFHPHRKNKRSFREAWRDFYWALNWPSLVFCTFLCLAVVLVAVSSVDGGVTPTYALAYSLVALTGSAVIFFLAVTRWWLGLWYVGVGACLFFAGYMWAQFAWHPVYKDSWGLGYTHEEALYAPFVPKDRHTLPGHLDRVASGLQPRETYQLTGAVDLLFSVIAKKHMWHLSWQDGNHRWRFSFEEYLFQDDDRALLIQEEFYARLEGKRVADIIKAHDEIPLEAHQLMSFGTSNDAADKWMNLQFPLRQVSLRIDKKQTLEKQVNDQLGTEFDIHLPDELAYVTPHRPYYLFYDTHQALFKAFGLRYGYSSVVDGKDVSFLWDPILREGVIVELLSVENEVTNIRVRNTGNYPVFVGCGDDNGFHYAADETGEYKIDAGEAAELTAVVPGPDYLEWVEQNLVVRHWDCY